MPKKQNNHTYCPICGKRVELCGCCFNIKENKYRVVLDHLYLLSIQEILHLCNLQKQMNIDYLNPKIQKINEEFIENRKFRLTQNKKD